MPRHRDNTYTGTGILVTFFVVTVFGEAADGEKAHGLIVKVWFEIRSRTARRVCGAGDSLIGNPSKNNNGVQGSQKLSNQRTGAHRRVTNAKRKKRQDFLNLYASYNHLSPRGGMPGLIVLRFRLDEERRQRKQKRRERRTRGPRSTLF